EPPTPHPADTEHRIIALGDASRHDRHPPCSPGGSSQRIDQGAIVGTVTRGLNDDVALKPEVIPEAPELHLRRIARRVAALGGVGKMRAGSEHVTVSIHRSLGRYEARATGRGMN